MKINLRGYLEHEKDNIKYNGPLKVGIGGPVGSGKTTLLIELCREFKKNLKFVLLLMTYTQKKMQKFYQDQVY